MYELDFSALTGEGYERLYDGFVVTCQLAVWSLLFAVCIGIIVGVMRWMGSRILEPFCWLYIEFARNTPPLVQILFWYFSASALLPTWLFMEMRNIGYEFASAVVAFSLYHGAFIAEVIRAGLNAIPRGQFEAARALGLSFHQVMGRVILPQSLRVVVPPLVNESVSLIKNTSLAMAIGVTEITYQYKYIDTYWFRGVEALAIATVLYMGLCLLISGLGVLMSQALSGHSEREAPVTKPLASE